MKISIIGAGKVGSAIAFSLLHNIGARANERFNQAQIAQKLDELILIDIIENLVKGEAEDLNHAKIALSPETKILGTSSYSEIKDSNIIIITAGKARTPGGNTTREQLFDFNKKIIEQICREIKKYSPDSKIITLTNPSTEIGSLVKSLLKNEVIVMDNQLDTARLKYYISKETCLPVSEIKSNITGTHGENMKINFKDEIPEGKKEIIRKNVLNAGRNIIELKGYTCWGIASQVVKVVKELI